MPLYFSSFRPGPIIDQAVPLFDIRTGPTDAATILDITGTSFPNLDLTSTVFGLGTPTVGGTAKNNGIGFVSDSGLALPGVTIGTDWTSLPTAPTKFFRRATMPTAIGHSNVFMQFPGGLKMAPSTVLVMWIITTNAMGNGALAFEFSMTVES